jgi:hypothetical protein
VTAPTSEAIEAVCSAWRCRAAKLDSAELLGKDDLKSWVEIKTRAFSKATYMISVQKIADLTALAAVSGVPAILVWR